MCSNPVLEVRGNRQFFRPCDGCLACRVDKLLLWQARCNSEYIKHRSAFVTFTYDEYHLHYADNALLPTLSKSDFQHYSDNIYHKVRNMPFLPEGCVSDYKYFACGEYGDSFGRPHYHVLFFGLDFHDFQKIFDKSWKNGLVKSLPILNGGIRYVVDYMTKNITGERAKIEYDDTNREHPFKTCSRGIGLDFFMAHRDEICDFGYVTMGSRKVPVPTYYRNLFQDFNPESVYAREKVKHDSFLKIMQDVKRTGFSDYDSYMNYKRKATELSIYSQLQNKGKPALPSYNSNQSFIDGYAPNYKEALRSIEDAEYLLRA